MTRVLPALHEGHAPVYLHEAFSAALDACEGWLPGADEPTVPLEGRDVPISAIFGRMRSCSDLLPERVLGDVVDVASDGWLSEIAGRPTYGDAAAVLRARCIDRLRDLGAGALRAAASGQRPAACTGG